MGFPVSTLQTREIAIVGNGVYERFLLSTLIIGILLLIACPAVAQQPDSSMGNMPGMDMSGKSDMGDMGPSMAAMAGHMYVTPLRPMQPGDADKAKAVVDAVRKSIARYQNYKNALADGYVIGNPEVKEPQYHFIKQANVAEAASHFDPAKPSALLYYRTPTERYKLEGVMFTVPPTASEDELNDRLPLSIVRWHKHVKFCAAPANRVQEYLGQHPKFGMFGSINTPDACKAEGGTFYPTVFTWMVHVFPYESDPKDIFSMNDDIPHFGSQLP